MRGRFFDSQRTRRLVVVCFIPLFSTLLVYIVGSFLGIRLNTTRSVPIGLYVVSSSAEASFAEFCPPAPFGFLSVDRRYRGVSSRCPDYGEPLLKPIVAAAGDVVEVSSNGISVNGVSVPNSAAQEKDSYGRSLQSWPIGVYAVEGDTLWVVSAYESRSFDSRYFGPIQASEVKNRLRPLWTTR